MRVLLIKTSSMGDLIHTLPALSDAGNAIPGIRFDWVAENAFTEIPSWHPLVDRVIPVSLRQWRKHIFSRETRHAFKAFRDEIKLADYDVVIDAQGLLKSAFLTFFVKGRRVGLDWSSARESLASLFYQQHCKVNFFQHAVVRMRELFSQALSYPLPETAPDFGLSKIMFTSSSQKEKYLVFLHGTTWASKQWPETYWVALARLAAEAGYQIKISGGSEVEVQRAERIAAECSAVIVYPYLKINEMASMLAGASGAVAVDTGFGHLAGALNLATVSIYGSTDAAYTGALGDRAVCLSAEFPCSPCLSRDCTYKQASAVTPACYTSVQPQRVWDTLRQLI